MLQKPQRLSWTHEQAACVTGSWEPRPQLLRSTRVKKRTWVKMALLEPGAPQRELPRERGRGYQPEGPTPPLAPGLYLLGTILSDQSHLGGPVLLGHHSHLGREVIALLLHL